MSEENEVESLKKLYINAINSIRTYERIKTLEDLVEVLADRDILPILQNYGKNIEDITSADLFDASNNLQLKRNINVFNLSDELCSLISADWKKIALYYGIKVEDCFGLTEEESASKLLTFLKINWGRISEKEYFFRLHHGLKALNLLDLSSKVSTAIQIRNKNKIMSYKEGHSSKDSKKSFSFLKYKRDVEAALSRYHLVEDWDDFWRFAQKIEAMHTSQPPEELNRRLFIRVNIKIGELLQRVSSRSLDESRLRQLLLIVQAFIAFKQSEKFNKLRKLRETQKSLPVAAFENDIVELLRDERVLIIAGDTGCGKSTQVPQYLMRNSKARVICTQPRRLACVALAARLKHETLTEYSQLIGYQIRFERRRNTDTQILFMTEGLLLRQLAADPSLSEWDVVILDEVHERHLHGDLLLGLLTCILQQRHDLRLVLMSATINTQLFVDYFKGKTKFLQVPGRLFPVDLHYRSVPKIDPKSRAKIDASPYLQVLQIIETKFKTELGDVLIFLSGVSEITCLVDAIEEWSRRDGSESWIILPLHGALSLSDQDRVFHTTAKGVRKCVVSTNIAETSLTIDGIRFVIDSGKMKEMSYDPTTRIQRLKEFWVSKSSADQRKGRAGRTGPGMCFRIYSQEDFEAMEDYPTAEVRRVPLDSVLLQVISMGLPDVRRFPFVEPPASDDLEASIASLKQLDALSDDEKLTPTGKQLANLPVDVQVGKMLLAGCVFRQAELALLLAAALSVPNPLTHIGMRDLSCETARSAIESPLGDPVSLAALYRHWLELKYQHENTRKWCRSCGLEEQRFYEITKLRSQFKDILTESGLLDEIEESSKSTAEKRIRSGEVKLLKSMKAEAEKNKPKKRELRMDDTDDKDLDVRDVDFRLSSDPNSVAQLLRELNVTSRRHLIVLRAVFCSGLYPQFAVADEHNAHGADPLYHTKTKAYVFIHPTSYFSKHHDLLQITESDIVMPNNSVRYTSRLHFSAKHQLLCYLGMLETTKVYLTSLLRMPALTTCLLFCKHIDAAFDFSKIVCDGWLLFEPLYPEEAESLILKVIKLRKQWSHAVEQRVTRSGNIGDVTLLADELELFLSTEIPYSMKRLLPADLNTIYNECCDFFLEDNPFDKEFKPKVHLLKGGLQVTDYLVYNCILPNEGQDIYGETSHHCPKCGEELIMNTLARIQHRIICVKNSLPFQINLPSSSLYACDICKVQQFKSTIEVLRHKRNCKG